LTLRGCAFPSQNSGDFDGIGLESAVSMDHIPAVASVMTPFPYSIDVADSLRRARGLMIEHEIRHLPVLHGQTLVGVLSDRDIKRALDPEMGLPPRDELLVRDAYVSEPYAVDASTALDVVLEYMAAHQVGSAIVTKHGRLAGIFTATDACRIYCEHLRRLFPLRSGEEVA
jgi:acetoin utilization protein AcuB